MSNSASGGGFRYFLVLILGLFLLSGCDKCEEQCPRCIAADDFGIPKISAVAFVESKSDLLRLEPAVRGKGEDVSSSEQILHWQDSGYVTSGEAINLRISGRWLFMTQRSILRIPKDKMQKLFRCGDIDYEFLKGLDPSFRDAFPDQNCNYLPVTVQDPVTYCMINGVEIDPKFSESGCILEKGYGLYLLFQRPGDPDPNLSSASIQTPSSPVMHAKYSGDNLSIDSVPTTDCTSLKIKKGWRIYYKILDRFYQNNIGGYSIEFRAGVVDSQQNTGVFEGIRSVLQELLNGQNEAIYRAMTSNNDYVALVKALIVLMIVLTGLRFLLGMSEHPASELLIRVLKMAIILQLISPSSWDFFYNNLFILFIDGLNEVIAIINSHTGAGYVPDKPFAFLDETVSILFKMLVSTKMKAILFSYMTGIFWWIILFFILLIYVVLVAYAFVVYMTALIGISVLIILMPILFLGMLFGQLKHTFDNWFTQALSFCFQAIMIFTVVSLFSAMIKDQFYRNIGYTVCCNKIFIIPFKGPIYGWSAGQNYESVSIQSLSSNNRVKFTGDAKIIDIPPYYKERGCRFVDYPFYDPQIDDHQCGVSGSTGKGPDWERIKAIQASDSGLLDILEVFTLLLLSVIMFHMRDLCQSIGASLVGASPFQAVIGGAYAAQDGIGGLYRSGKMLLGAFAEKLPVSSIVRTGIDDALSLKSQISEKIAARLNESNIGGNAMKVLSVVGDVSAGVVGGASYLSGMSSDLSDHYYEKKVFRHINYAQGMMGYHLGGMLGTRDLSDAPGIRMLFGGMQHVSDKYLVARKEDTLFGGLGKLYACEREKIHDYYLGVKKEGLVQHLCETEEEKESKEPPFAPSKDSLVQDGVLEDEKNSSLHSMLGEEDGLARANVVEESRESNVEESAAHFGEVNVIASVASDIAETSRPVSADSGNMTPGRTTKNSARKRKKRKSLDDNVSDDIHNVEGN